MSQESITISDEHLSTIFKFAQKYADNDLWKFFLSDEHRQIDKWLHYFEVYDKWFKDFRNKDIVFVEIGVQNGGSAQMWRHYFGDKATIIGVDIDERCKQFDSDDIKIEIGSQEDVEFWNTFKEKYPRVDILLDDGGHTMAQQIITFQCMFDHIADGGIYLCEDTHTSYWAEYGAVDEKSAENNYTEFAKTFIDEVNAFHSRGKVPISNNTLTMHGLHFYDSMVVIEKQQRLLGPVSLKIGKQFIFD